MPIYNLGQKDRDERQSLLWSKWMLTTFTFCNYAISQWFEKMKRSKKSTFYLKLSLYWIFAILKVLPGNWFVVGTFLSTLVDFDEVGYLCSWLYTFFKDCTFVHCTYIHSSYILEKETLFFPTVRPHKRWDFIIRKNSIFRNACVLRWTWVFFLAYPPLLFF